MKDKFDARGTRVNGIEAAALATRGLGGRHGGPLVQIAYDYRTGDVVTTEHVAETNYTRYDDPDVITVCFTGTPMSEARIMAEINDVIVNVVTDTTGDRIRAAREAAGLTQQQLADEVASGVRQRVYGWERNIRTPRRETLERIAEVLGTTPGKLMFGE